MIWVPWRRFVGPGRVRYDLSRRPRPSTPEDYQIHSTALAGDRVLDHGVTYHAACRVAREDFLADLNRPAESVTAANTAAPLLSPDDLWRRNTRIGRFATAVIALHNMHYDFDRIHKSLRVTAAIEAGVSGHV